MAEQLMAQLKVVENWWVENTHQFHFNHLHADMSHLPQSIADPLADIHKVSGLPTDQIRFVLCLLMGLPFGFIHRLLPGAFIKHIYSLFLGVLYVWFVTGLSGAIHPLISSVVTYVILAIFPVRISPLVVFIWSMLYMSVSHIYRLYNDYLGWKLDYTTAQMMVTIKMCTLAFNYADGQLLKRKQKLSDHEKTAKFREERSLDGLPNLIYYFSYIYFFGGVLCGPCFEIKEYLSFTDGSLFKKYNLSSPPSSGLAALKCMGQAILCYVGVHISSMYPVMGHVDTKAFQESGTVLSRMVYMFIGMTSFRFKYYFAWYIAEAGCVASGFGFNGFADVKGKKVTLWDRVQNADAWAVETATSLPQLTNSWNKGANNWLKNYVYFRLDLPFLHKAQADMVKNILTKVTSALWHGFYPAYYFFFVSVAFATFAHEAWRKCTGHLVYTTNEKGEEKAKNVVVAFIYDIITWLLLFTPMNYMGVAFALLTTDKTFSSWSSVFFAGHALVVLLFLLTSVMRPKRSRDKANIKVGGEAAAKKQE